VSGAAGLAVWALATTAVMPSRMSTSTKAQRARKAMTEPAYARRHILDQYLGLDRPPRQVQLTWGVSSLRASRSWEPRTADYLSLVPLWIAGAICQGDYVQVVSAPIGEKIDPPPATARQPRHFPAHTRRDGSRLKRALQ